MLLGCSGRVGGVGLVGDIAAVHGGSRHGGVSASERRAAMSSEAERGSIASENAGRGRVVDSMAAVGARAGLARCLLAHVRTQTRAAGGALLVKRTPGPNACAEEETGDGECTDGRWGAARMAWVGGWKCRAGVEVKSRWEQLGSGSTARGGLRTGVAARRIRVGARGKNKLARWLRARMREAAGTSAVRMNADAAGEWGRVLLRAAQHTADVREVVLFCT